MHILGIPQFNSYFNTNVKNKSNINHSFPIRTLTQDNNIFVLRPLTKDTISFSGKSATKKETIPNNYLSTQTIKNAVNKLTTDDEDVKEAVTELLKNESIVIRTKEEATPILQELHNNIPAEDRKHLFVLNINPQYNSGLKIQKSNTLISQWYKEVNNLEDEQLITLLYDEVYGHAKMTPEHVYKGWTQTELISKEISKYVSQEDVEPSTTEEDGQVQQEGVVPLPIEEAREIIKECQSLSPTDLLEKYYDSENNVFKTGNIKKLAAALKTKSKLYSNVKKKGCAKLLAEQLNNKLNEAKEQGAESVSIVIPDDCSLSGSSIITDTVKILSLMKYPENLKINLYFAPLILGNLAENRIKNFNKIDFNENYEKFLHDIGAIKIDEDTIKYEIKKSDISPNSEKYLQHIPKQIKGPIKYVIYDTNLTAESKKFLKEIGATKIEDSPIRYEISGAKIDKDTLYSKNLKTRKVVGDPISYVFQEKNLDETSKKYIENIGARKITEATLKYLIPKEAFEETQNKIQKGEMTWNIIDGSKKAQHFEETETFKKFNNNLKEKTKAAIQGKNGMYKGYQGCGVMVITPTEELVIDGKTYAGKIPTNSVGVMEVLGHSCGVLNDDEGVFTKGSGPNYHKFSQDDNCVKEKEKPIHIKTDKSGKIIKDEGKNKKSAKEQG